MDVVPAAKCPVVGWRLMMGAYIRAVGTEVRGVGELRG